MPKALSVQLYTVRDLMAEDRDAVLRRIAELGFDAVEPYQPTVDPVGFRKVADDLGLRVSSAHAMGLIQDEDPGPVFEAIATLGTDLAIVPAGIAEAEFTTREGLGFWPAAALAMAVTALAGLLVGLPALRMQSHYLGIVTLGLALGFINWTTNSGMAGGAEGISVIPVPPIGRIVVLL